MILNGVDLNKAILLGIKIDSCFQSNPPWFAVSFYAVWCEGLDGFSRAYFAVFLCSPDCRTDAMLSLWAHILLVALSVVWFTLQ